MSETASTGKPKIRAKDLVADIKSGMGHESLMRKYGLSSEGLYSAYDKLIENRLITNAQLHSQHHISGRPKLQSRNQVAPHARNSEESGKQRPWPFAVRLLSIVGGCLVGGSLVVVIYASVFTSVVDQWKEYVPLGEGIHVVTENTLITDRLDDYDRLTRFIEQDDKGAIEQLRIR